jgi:hypothetical protein
MYLIRSQVLLGIVAIASCMLSTTTLSLAAEHRIEGKDLKAEPNPISPGDVVTSPGKKKGGPVPPADPQCPIGSSPVGPVTHETFSRACTVNGKAGTQTCYNKTVTCLSGPGEPQTASSQNCTRCVAAPNQPGQVESPTGR